MYNKGYARHVQNELENLRQANLYHRMHCKKRKVSDTAKFTAFLVMMISIIGMSLSSLLTNSKLCAGYATQPNMVYMYTNVISLGLIPVMPLANKRGRWVCVEVNV